MVCAASAGTCKQKTQNPAPATGPAHGQDGTRPAPRQLGALKRGAPATRAQPPGAALRLLPWPPPAGRGSRNRPPRRRPPPARCRCSSWRHRWPGTAWRAPLHSFWRADALQRYVAVVFGPAPVTSAALPGSIPVISFPRISPGGDGVPPYPAAADVARSRHRPHHSLSAGFKQRTGAGTSCKRTMGAEGLPTCGSEDAAPGRAAPAGAKKPAWRGLGSGL